MRATYRRHPHLQPMLLLHAKPRPALSSPLCVYWLLRGTCYQIGKHNECTSMLPNCWVAA